MHKKQNIISCIVILLLLAVMIFSVTQILIKVNPSEDSKQTDSKTLIIDGVKYFPKQDIQVFMLMGIDRSGTVKDSGSYRNDGEADMVVLSIFNDTDRTCSVLCLDRDTMLKMPTLGVSGKYAGSTFGQLALAHTYGSGLEDSSENTKKAVSDFLYGLEIDYYVSLNMDAVAILNDAVDGVTVEVTDEFPEESGIKKGEFTLRGDQALTFVRARKDVGDQLNTSRIERQKAYMEGFIKALGKKFETSDSFVLDTYTDISDYMVTDCSVDTLSKFVSRYNDYEFKELVSPEGKNSTDSGYMEFTADPDKLEKLILRLFYDKKEI